MTSQCSFIHFQNVLINKSYFSTLDVLEDSVSKRVSWATFTKLIGAILVKLFGKKTYCQKHESGKNSLKRGLRVQNRRNGVGASLSGTFACFAKNEKRLL